MDLIERLRDLGTRISKQLDSIQTEEATKTAIIMPFISILGYNVFDPTEVTPELVADVGLKKGEKVDYAILKEGKPVILFECKHHATDLGKVHSSQLYRYFNVTEARFAILTNGITYWFFTDLEEPNKMDEKPFFEFNLLDIKDFTIEELKKFTKPNFDVSNILTTASELKYRKGILNLISEQMNSPDPEFVRFFVSRLYSGRMTPVVASLFSDLIKKAFKLFINEQINDRLKTALAADNGTKAEKEEAPPPPSTPADAVTTEDEVLAYYIIKAILAETVPSNRVAIRDKKSYCGILLDDNNRKPLCRLYYLGK